MYLVKPDDRGKEGQSTGNVMGITTQRKKHQK